MVETTHSAGFWPGLVDPLRQLGARVADWFSPASDASRADAAYEIRLELPGVAPEDVDVSLHDGALVVKGEKRESRTEEGRSWFFSERQWGAFQRSFRLPPDADADHISADMTHGVLTLSIPRRSPEAPGGRRIEVRG